MLRRSIPIKSSISSIRHLLNVMTSQANDLQRPCQCKNSLLSRQASSCSTNSGKERKTGESVDCRSTERRELQWHNLSEDEKNIYVAHKNACMNGENSYSDPVIGYMVFTEEFLSKRRTCCGNGCRHCPYGHENVPHSQRTKRFNSAFYV